MKKIVFFLLITSNYLFGQYNYDFQNHIDTVENLLKNNQVKKANKYSKKLIETGKLNKDSLLVALGYKFKGNIQHQNIQIDSSTNSYKKGVNYLNNKKEKLYADLLTNIGRNYGGEGMIDSMLYYHKIALPIYKKLKNKRGLSILHFGQVYSYIKKFNFFEGEKSLNQLLIIAEKYKDPLTEARAYYMLGMLNAVQKNFIESVKLFKKAVKIFEEENDLISLISTYSAISSVLILDKNFEGANNWVLKALKILEEENIPISGAIIELYSNYINILIKSNKLDKAQEVIDLTKKFDYKYLKPYRGVIWINELSLLLKKQQFQDFSILSKEYNSNEINIEFRPEYNKILAEYYLRIKDYKLAFKSKEEYWRLKDSILNNEIRNKVIYNQQKFESTIKEKENLQLKADNIEQELLTQKANTRNWLLLLGLIAAGIVSFVIWKRYKSEARAKATILNQKNVIENLQKELHHRVKNNLAIIDTFIEVAKEEFDNNKFDVKLTEIQNRIVSINEIHKQLYQNSDVTNLDIKNYIDVLSKNVSQSFTNKKITLQNNIENINLNADTSFPVGLIINEFLTNSYKHAFEKEGNIIIEMKDKGQEYLLTLSDNGKGLPKDFDIEQIETFGLRIMKLLTKQINGVYSLESNNGLQLTIQIPKV
ncbi:hypothetical protein H9I45_11915 [Polaribacter haliotis]|uniref:histidine kinase n=1 Tax=Polaribacter haliotis TaxID=1888915 RepID=A0A7L8ADG7_9FLAO|nr:histidine kinase dimerization/phosphoacceptor domain -containing protein [Polaribacter haliotis]QOD60045.1 hypothetical protein H9I45_11915 [Polaribacter haliotis]